jgi:trk system potassium uptake protein TrkH
MFQGNDEVKIVAAVIAVLALVYTARIAEAAGTLWHDLGPVLLEGFFTAVSLVATSGIETRPGVIALLPAVLVMIIVMIGASVYSTTGGIKYYRLATMTIFARAELNRLIYPRSITPSRFSGQPIAEESIRATWAYFVLVILSVAAGTVLITISAANFEGGLALAVSFFSSAGPVYDALRPVTEGVPGAASGWPSFAELPATAVIPAVLLMTIGRLEVLIVFAVVNISYWRKR